jgi:hypothetical protein
MIVFNHIPRTAGTFIVEKIRASGLCDGPRIDLRRREKWIPTMHCDRFYRPRMLTYHCSGIEFGNAYQRHPGDFTFTFLRNRVDMIYSNFAYMSVRVRRGDRFSGWPAQRYEYYRGSVRQHVDNVLRGKEDDTYPSDLTLYDFIGVTEDMDRSLNVLNKVLGTALSNDQHINCVASEKTYRRAELETKFAAQIEIHARAREILHGTRYDSLKPLAEPNPRQHKALRD